MEPFQVVFRSFSLRHADRAWYWRCCADRERSAPTYNYTVYLSANPSTAFYGRRRCVPCHRKSIAEYGRECPILRYVLPCRMLRLAPVACSMRHLRRDVRSDGEERFLRGQDRLSALPPAGPPIVRLPAPLRRERHMNGWRSFLHGRFLMSRRSNLRNTPAVTDCPGMKDRHYGTRGDNRFL